jgi:hypothetical protein
MDGRWTKRHPLMPWETIVVTPSPTTGYRP